MNMGRRNTHQCHNDRQVQHAPDKRHILVLAQPIHPQSCDLHALRIVVQPFPCCLQIALLVLQVPAKLKTALLQHLGHLEKICGDCFLLRALVIEERFGASNFGHRRVRSLLCAGRGCAKKLLSLLERCFCGEALSQCRLWLCLLLLDVRLCGCFHRCCRCGPSSCTLWFFQQSVVVVVVVDIPRRRRRCCRRRITAVD